MSQNKRPSLCWDCANATGFCDWSRSNLPIEGWTAVKTGLNSSLKDGSYIVVECPEFERDAIRGGLVRYKGDELSEFV